MKLLAVLAALSLAGTCNADWENLYLKYDMFLDGFFPIALTQDKLLKGNWAYMATDSDLNVDFYCYGGDPRVSIGFDIYGNIAGVRVSYIIADLATTATENGVSFNYTFTDKPIFSNATYMGSEVYYSTVLFVSPEKLKAGGRNYTGDLLADDIYMKINGTYTVIPRHETNATEVGLVKQNCFMGMGRHYFLGLSSSLSDCNELQGVYAMYTSGELSGVGLIPFGSFTSGQRQWFENPGLAVVKVNMQMIIPDRPDCLLEWSKDYGTSSLHMFFNKHPRLSYC